jgi:hypothetical protein
MEYEEDNFVGAARGDARGELLLIPFLPWCGMEFHDLKRPQAVNNKTGSGISTRNRVVLSPKTIAVMTDKPKLT